MIRSRHTVASLSIFTYGLPVTSESNSPVSAYDKRDYFVPDGSSSSPALPTQESSTADLVPTRTDSVTTATSSAVNSTPVISLEPQAIEPSYQGDGTRNDGDSLSSTNCITTQTSHYNPGKQDTSGSSSNWPTPSPQWPNPIQNGQGGGVGYGGPFPSAQASTSTPSTVASPTESSKSSAPTFSSSNASPTITSSPPSTLISIVYSTSLHTVYSCPPSITDCPLSTSSFISASSIHSYSQSSPSLKSEPSKSRTSHNSSGSQSSTFPGSSSSHSSSIISQPSSTHRSTPHSRSSKKSSRSTEQTSPPSSPISSFPSSSGSISQESSSTPSISDSSSLTNSSPTTSRPPISSLSVVTGIVSSSINPPPEQSQSSSSQATPPVSLLSIVTQIGASLPGSAQTITPSANFDTTGNPSSGSASQQSTMAVPPAQVTEAPFGPSVDETITPTFTTALNGILILTIPASANLGLSGVSTITRGSSTLILVASTISISGTDSSLFSFSIPTTLQTLPFPTNSSSSATLTTSVISSISSSSSSSSLSSSSSVIAAPSSSASLIPSATESINPLSSTASIYTVPWPSASASISVVPKPQPSTHKSLALPLGIGLGLGIPFLLAFIFLAFILYRRRQNNLNDPDDPDDTTLHMGPPLPQAPVSPVTGFAGRPDRHFSREFWKTGIVPPSRTPTPGFLPEVAETGPLLMSGAAAGVPGTAVGGGPDVDSEEGVVSFVSAGEGEPVSPVDTVANGTAGNVGEAEPVSPVSGTGELAADNAGVGEGGEGLRHSQVGVAT